MECFLKKEGRENKEDTDMASIREHVEIVFAALAFAERDLPREARELLDSASDRTRTNAVASATRTDNRPRVRV
jgi:hypothetical protein